MKKDIPNMDDIFNTVSGQTLKYYRTQKGLSLEEVVKKMKGKISRQSLYKYENGKARLKTDTFFDICQALNLDPKILFKEINIKTNILLNKLVSSENNENFAEAMTEFLIGLSYNNFLRDNDLPHNDYTIFDEMEILFENVKNLFSEEEQKDIKKMIEDKRKDRKQIIEDSNKENDKS